VTSSLHSRSSYRLFSLLSVQQLLEMSQKPYEGSGYDGLDYHKFASLAMLRSGIRPARGDVCEGSIGNLSQSEVELVLHPEDGEDPFELTLDTLAKISPMIPTIWRVEPWWEHLMHRCIILYDLVAKVLNCGTTDVADDIADGILYNAKELMRSVERDVSKTHPREAKELSQQLEDLARRVEIRNSLKVI